MQQMEVVPEVNSQVLDVTEPTVILKNDVRKFQFFIWQFTSVNCDLIFRVQSIGLGSYSEKKMIWVLRELWNS